MTEKIKLALEMHSKDPAVAEQNLRRLINEDPGGFVRASAALVSEPGESGCQPLAQALAQSAAAVEQLCDPDLLAKEFSTALARQIARNNPVLENKLARLLPVQDGNGSDPARNRVAERILELLDAISVSSRVIPMLASLLRHPDARLRAKVSLLIGRLSPNVRTAEDRLEASDSRMRANAVESLWGDKTGRAASVLWRAVKDADNRVVGNALFGLYEMQDASVIPYILSMASHVKPKFRATAAWTMGQTGDPQFLPVLEKLTHDLYAPVRKRAARAIEQIGKQAQVEQAFGL